MNKISWLDKLEAKFGHLALDGLMRYVALLMFTVFLLNYSGKLSYGLLTLNGAAIMEGQIWRLVTFLFIPMSNHPLWLFFELMIIIMCADGIEGAMGSFKLSLYYILGAVFMIIGSLVAPGVQYSSYYMYLTLFFGYATIYPDQELMFMFIIPVKIKYLAYLSAAGILLQLFTSSSSVQIAIMLSFANYFLFFAWPALQGVKYQMRQEKRRKAFEEAATPTNKEFRHKCAICGKTDVSNPELLFKYCTCKECGENGVAFCPEHLAEHKAKKGEVK